MDKNSARLSCYYEIIYVCVNIYGGKGLNLKNFSLDTNIYIYIYTLDEFVYRIIVRDFEKWRLEVSFGSFDRKRAERERERDWEAVSGGHPSQQLLSAPQSCAFPNSSNRFPLVLFITRSILLIVSRRFITPNCVYSS